MSTAPRYAISVALRQEDFDLMEERRKVLGMSRPELIMTAIQRLALDIQSARLRAPRGEASLRRVKE